MRTKFVRQAERLIDSETARLVQRRLQQKTDPNRIARSFAGLRSKRAFTQATNTVLSRLESLLKDIPQLTVQQSSKRRRGLAHLFSGEARSDPVRLQYRKTLNEFTDLIDTPNFQKLLAHVPSRRMLEDYGHALFSHIAGTSDSYDDLLAETKTFNALIKRLYPDDFPSLRIDAHHIIEGRAYENFAETWKLLGWESANDMPAIPLLYEFHIRSPKRLTGMQELVKKGDITSLSRQLLTTIKLEKINSPEELIKSYIAYYSKTAIWKDVRPVLQSVEQEITRRKTAARLVRELTKAKQ